MPIYGDKVKCIPGISSGDPCVRGVKTSILAGRFSAGNTIKFLAEDFDIAEKDVEAAIRYELQQFARWRPRGWEPTE